MMFYSHVYILYTIFQDQSWYEETVGKTWVDWLAEEDLVKLRPLLFVELTVMMDSNGVRFNRRKPHKRKRKEGKL